MRRISVILAAMLLALAMTAGSALAMQPPGQAERVDDRFDCIEGDHDESLNPVYGHPGAEGLVPATRDHAASSTAWESVFNSEAIVNSCEDPKDG